MNKFGKVRWCWEPNLERLVKLEFSQLVFFSKIPRRDIRVVSEHRPRTCALRPSIEEKVAAISYYFEDFSEDDY